MVDVRVIPHISDLAIDRAGLPWAYLANIYVGLSIPLSPLLFPFCFLGSRTCQSPAEYYFRTTLSI